MLVSTGSSMKSYAQQCGSVAEVDVAMGGEVGSLEEAHPIAASGLEEYCFGSGRCVDSLIAKALSTIDLMNPSLYPNSVDSRDGCLVVSIVANASLGPVPLEELVLFLASMVGVESLV